MYIKFNILKKLFIPTFLLLFIQCGQPNSDINSLEIDVTNSTIKESLETNQSTVLENTTSTSTITTVYVCSPEDNSSINFNNLKNVQNFLNRYGFNAGEEDGYLGNQTISAIKDFQNFAGLKPDGDVGPATRKVMNNWTGCENKAVPYTENNNENIANETPTDSTTTSTSSTTTSSTTTTIPTQNISNTNTSYGYQPSVLITTNQITTVFKGTEDTTSICGVPYLNNLDNGAINMYQNGLLKYESVGNSIFTESSSTAEIVNVTSNSFTINVLGNGDKNFKFYFIKPFESDVSIVPPKSISTSSGITTAVFDKSSFEQGYWFFSFAENNSGQIVKSVGLREILIGDEITQIQASNNEIDTIFFLKDNQNISKGLNLNSVNNIDLIYTTKNLYDTRENTTNDISESANTITLKNDSQATSGQILHIGRELMLVTAKNGSTYTVERGYLGTQKQSHAIGSQVKVIKNSSKQSIQSSFAYAVIRSESGFRYQIPLGSELVKNRLTTNKCPNGLYSFEEITIFSWRPQGSSVVYTSTVLDKNNPIFDKQFLINNSYNYLPPTLSGTDSDGSFINKGPKNTSVSDGDRVVFDFSGVNVRSSSLKFAELKFTMNPINSSGKISKIRSVFFEIPEDYIFEIKVDKIISSNSVNLNIWESGYKYIFDSLILYDEVSKTTFKNNQEVIYDYTSSKSTHNAYYLDQFIFNIP